MCSVIIPAHNEAGVIGRCLSAIAEFGKAGRAQVIVVCNGCSDDTAAQARACGDWVRVIETPVASKSVALNLGDQAASFFPRIYLDADVVLSADALGALCEELDGRKCLAAAPRAHLDLSAASWAVRAFYAIDTRLPWARQGIGGSGVYGLTAEGRKRFDEFPPITADDGFVRLQFSRDERAFLDTAVSIVTPPRRLSELVAIKSRSHFGKYELRSRFPQLMRNEGEPNTRALARLALSPTNWPALAVYAYVKLAARRRGWRRFSDGDHQVWERDQSSRLGGMALAPATR